MNSLPRLGKPSVKVPLFKAFSFIKSMDQAKCFTLDLECIPATFLLAPDGSSLANWSCMYPGQRLFLLHSGPLLWGEEGADKYLLFPAWQGDEWEG